MDTAKPYEFERRAAYTRLTLSADLNAFHWEDLQRSAAEILTEFEKSKPKAVIVDLSLLNYLGSAQLTVLVRIWKVLKGTNGRMIVELKGPVVREVLKTAGLLNVWEFAESRPAAFQLLGLQPDGRTKLPLVLPLIGMVALVAALAALCLSIWRTGIIDARTALILQLSCSALALGAGLWTAIRGSGVHRGLGAGMVVASTLLAVAVVMYQPR